jgi:hemolysin-activating ACP:hemolysin acyltransferase
MSTQSGAEMTQESHKTRKLNGISRPDMAESGRQTGLNKQEPGISSHGQTSFSGVLINVLGVLMRDPSFRGMRLSDVEWLVIPPVLAGQCRLAQMPMPAGLPVSPPDAGTLMPVAVALWARVSDAIDARLVQAIDKPVDIRSTEWSTGDNYWLLAVAGDPRVVPALLGQLEAREFKDKNTRLRARGPGDRTEIVTLTDYLQRLD